MKTKIEIIEEVFDNHFVLDPSKRSTSKNTGCLYLSPNGNKCAVGMCMNFDKYEDEILDKNEEVYIDDMDYLLKPEYQGHSEDFWEMLQCLHDGNYYWDNKGLSEDGKKRLEIIKEKFEPLTPPQDKK